MKRFLAVLMILVLLTAHASAVTLPRKIVVPKNSDDPGMDELLATADYSSIIGYTIEYDDFSLTLDYNEANKELEDITIDWTEDKSDIRSFDNRITLFYETDGTFSSLFSDHKTNEDGVITTASEILFSEYNSHSIKLEICTQEKTEVYYYNASNESGLIDVDEKGTFVIFNAKSGIKFTHVDDKITEETKINSIPVEYPLYDLQIAGTLDVLAGTYEIPDEYPAVTVRGGVKVYKEANTRSGEVVTLRQGREVTVFGEEGDFYQVRVDLGNKVLEGYVQKNFLKDQ